MKIFCLGEKYAPHQNYELCEDNEEVDVRDGCNLKQDCLFNARNICDKNSTCFGIAWLKDDLEQKMVVCLSGKMITTEMKWQTILKVWVPPKHWYMNYDWVPFISKAPALHHVKLQ